MSTTAGRHAERVPIRETVVSARPVGLARAWRAVAFPVTRYLAIAVLLHVVVWFAATHLDRNPSYPERSPIVFSGDAVVEGWVRWDAGYYVQIAASGYTYSPDRASSVAFFPAYPLAMRAVMVVVGDPVLTGILVTMASGLVASIVFFRWARVVAREGAMEAGVAADEHRVDATARLALLLLLLFPYAFYFYGAIYADAFFVAAAVAAFLALERNRPVVAGLLGAVATAARPMGAGVILGLVAVLLERRGAVSIPLIVRARRTGWRAAWHDRSRLPARNGHGIRPRRADSGANVGEGGGDREPWVRVGRGGLRARDAGVLLSAGGLLAWMAYLRRAFGDPLLFVTAEGAPGWDQAPGLSTWLKVPWLRLWRHVPEYLGSLGEVPMLDKLHYTLGTTFQAILIIGALALVPVVIRRLGWGYGVYVVAVAAIPVLGSKDWMGTGRYLLALFPVAAALAGRMVEGRHRWVPLLWLAVSGAVLVFFASAFARGYYLA